jgi:hypothetical protein
MGSHARAPAGLNRVVWSGLGCFCGKRLSIPDHLQRKMILRACGPHLRAGSGSPLHWSFLQQCSTARRVLGALAAWIPSRFKMKNDLVHVGSWPAVAW